MTAAPKESASKFLVLDNKEAESDDSDDWGSSSDEDMSSSSDDEKYDGNLALKFLKKYVRFTPVFFLPRGTIVSSNYVSSS